MAQSIPEPTRIIAALAILYGLMAVAAIAVAVGTTFFVWAHVDVYSAIAVGGGITFAVSYVGVRIIDAVRTGVTNE